MGGAAQKSRPTPFAKVGSYLEALHQLAFEPASNMGWEKKCFAALNGQASETVRRVASIKLRRKFGAFFTSAELGTRLLDQGAQFDRQSLIYDPTCGMGDLLLSVARLLPLRRSVSETLRVWGECLAGTDLHAEFVEGAKARLILLARDRHRGVHDAIPTSKDYFQNIRVGNGLEANALYDRASHIVINPPYGAMPMPDDCVWATGEVTGAAIFLMRALEHAKAGTRVLAILPEVLRSGAFSGNWRETVASLAHIDSVEPYGIFDRSADVDVFLLRLKKAVRGLSARTWPTVTPTDSTIGDLFAVHVGRVVPHRDRRIGKRYRYIHPRCLPPWKTVDRFAEYRKHKGLPFSPPFVAIRRTSRPEHPYRAVATVIGGTLPVAVENHLIVCLPNDGKLSTCKKLALRLKSTAVNAFLNERIRCRHLTVASVSEIPLSALSDLA